MKYKFKKYKPRKIEFQKLVTILDWNIKIYSIANKDEFQSAVILKPVMQELPNWIAIAKDSNLPVYNTAFVIIHEAREGFLILFNWWTGGEMLETKVYFSDFKMPNEIDTYPYHPKSLVCIWELEIFAHERQAWINHILMQNENPDFEKYLIDTLKLTL